MDWSFIDFSPAFWAAFFQVVWIDLPLAGDNAVVTGLAAAGLPKAQRGKAIFFGIVAATVLRIIFALMTTTLLKIPGLLLFGGVLLLWVSWKMWRELMNPSHASSGVEASGGDTRPGDGDKPKTLRDAITQIIVADVSMSLDNVLAVAGAASEHPQVLIFGLALSIGLMGFAATFIARLLDRHRWIGFIGLAIILYVSLHMIWKGGKELLEATAPPSVNPAAIELPDRP